MTERREHAEQINVMLIKRGVDERLLTAQVVVATGKYVGEGFDLPRLDTLFLSMPIAWKGSLTQYAGRIHWESAGKGKVTIFDYVDVSLPMLQRMFRKRENGYKAMGYTIKHPDTNDMDNSNRQLLLAPTETPDYE